MSRKCPKCLGLDSKITKHGFFVRHSDKRRILRLKCECGCAFSKATFQSCYRQKKRRVNKRILELICSGMSQRRIARVLKLNRKTVSRKLMFLANRAKNFNLRKLNSLALVTRVQFDDLETIEHTKCKPLSVTLAVNEETRRILDFRVSQMPAKGHLAKISYRKYGFRKDMRSQGRRDLFRKLQPRIAQNAVIESDQNPHYVEDVKKYFPTAFHKAYPGQRGSVSGQGELKKIVFDPLFTLNHTFAMLRANINRLFRKTWCTTKLPERLTDHIALYTYYHNEVLIKKAS